MDIDTDEAWKEYIRTRDPVLRNQLAEHYLPLVSIIAGSLARTLPRSVDIGDLNGNGTIGLIDAVEHFDPDRGVKFNTYGSLRIRGAMLDGLRKEDWTPRLTRTRQKLLKEAGQELFASLRRQPTHQELADFLGMTADELTALHAEAESAQVFSLFDTWTAGMDDQEVERKDFIPDPGEGPEQQLLDREAVEEIRKRIGKAFPRTDRVITDLYFFEGYTMRRIADLLGLTESRVCQRLSAVATRLEEIFLSLKEKEAR
ncbi:MAG: FliA/WhiG family RNA polymerase sigma factor [Candidatus Aenigmarchaeota archaeon]|nr:FliA/WhiG family RNA polymerase sigma factor [Candidatus Aenigmarchaeota archaeon]